ncbi:nitroimidazol reductase NimA-like FMN-containing flavoprotein (pyridoxamine 5'-phosphate oxidase superfamily) [Streptomyces sp. T12]|nr:nitroimidazol reductase NimA-like FMN-containing flavoprotein (pyridoxamine 5'-phosphate oxidase superfamily) [Streptomyces sp. T12]
MIHSDGFRALDRQECLRLLGKVPVGRVVYTRQALPAVLPVNFSLDTDGAVVLCTSAQSDLVRAVDGVVVAFEADDFQGGRRSGWSVVVTGRAAVVSDPADHERLLRTGPRSWMPMRDGVFVRIGGEMVTGRELTGGADRPRPPCGWSAVSTPLRRTAGRVTYGTACDRPHA